MRVLRGDAVAVANELALEVVVGHLRAVAKLHRPATDNLLTYACWQGDCEHLDDPNVAECPEVATTYCVECSEASTRFSDEACVILWPCDTVKALGGPELAAKLLVDQ